MTEGLLIFLCWLPPVLLAITLHESAHGFAARYFGDPTAHQAGRISLNPLRHIDPVGTIMVPMVLYWSSILLGGSGLLFGWAKPVPVDFGRLRRPKTDMIWVAAAGPLVNLLMALGWAVLLVAVYNRSLVQPDSVFEILRLMAQGGISINIILFIFNLFPIPPLDGGRIVTGLLPLSLARPFARLEPFGMLIVLVLLFSGVATAILRPLFNFTQDKLLLLASGLL